MHILALHDIEHVAGGMPVVPPVIFSTTATDFQMNPAPWISAHEAGPGAAAGLVAQSATPLLSDAFMVAQHPLFGATFAILLCMADAIQNDWLRTRPQGPGLSKQNRRITPLEP